jgi:DNA replication protein DnaC
MEALLMLLRVLKLPTVARHADEVAQKAEREGWTFGQYLRHLVELEVEERRRRRIERNLRDSGLPGEKTLATLERKRLPAPVAKLLPTLCEGGFVERGDNVLLFGLPGRGKTHVACALGHELVRRGHRVLFTPTYALVQRLLAAKRDLRLEKELAKLDGFDAVVLDDIGYVQQNRDEMEVLFTFLAERYERKSVLITSNLVFSEMESNLQGPDDHRGGHRPARPPRRHPRDEWHQRARRPRQERTQGGQSAHDNYDDNYGTSVKQGGRTGRCNCR